MSPTTATAPTARFRPHERIRDPQDFRLAFDRRRSVSDAVLVVYGVENGRDHARLGISIGRKKVRSAAHRNQLKRLIREAFRLNKAAMPPGVDLVVLPRSPKLTFAQISESLPALARDITRRLRGGRANPSSPKSSTSGRQPASNPRPESGTEPEREAEPEFLTSARPRAPR
jgi:ribonuclease P protein component